MLKWKITLQRDVKFGRVGLHNGTAAQRESHSMLMGLQPKRPFAA